MVVGLRDLPREVADGEGQRRRGGRYVGLVGWVVGDLDSPGSRKSQEPYLDAEFGGEDGEERECYCL